MKQKGGKPNTDEVIMLKMLILQLWYGLSDPELENTIGRPNFIS
ncbi:MAG: transposase [Methanobrevibacter sp.]|nr:transposase [Candidatus Methanovirga aequatorialis]